MYPPIKWFFFVHETYEWKNVVKRLRMYVCVCVKVNTLFVFRVNTLILARVRALMALRKKSRANWKEVARASEKRTKEKRHILNDVMKSNLLVELWKHFVPFLQIQGKRINFHTWQPQKMSKLQFSLVLRPGCNYHFIVFILLHTEKLSLDWFCAQMKR